VRSVASWLEFAPLAAACLGVWFFASHKAKCAELRKKNTPLMPLPGVARVARGYFKTSASAS